MHFVLYRPAYALIFFNYNFVIPHTSTEKCAIIRSSERNERFRKSKIKGEFIMKKHMIIIAMMSMIVTLAGCGKIDEPNNMTNNTTAESVSVTGSPEAESIDAVNSADSNASGVKSDEQKESTESGSEKKKETKESNSDRKKETPENKTDVKQVSTENKPAEKKETQESVNTAAESVNTAASDISEIVGEWGEIGGDGRFLTVYSDAGFEVRTGNSGSVSSGTVTAEIKDGVKKFNFYQGELGLWYVPFELFPSEGGDIFLQTEDNPVYDTVRFSRCYDVPENTGYNAVGLDPVYGTWYDQDYEIGRELTVNGDGSYTIINSDGGTENGYITYDADNFYELHSDSGETYSFYLIDDGGDQQLCGSSANSPAYTASFGRSPSQVTAVGSIENIVGEWFPDDPSMEFTLVVESDGTYSINGYDGSVKTNTVSVGVRDGVVKYTFHADILGTWYVPFELRGDTLITEDNPVYDDISFHR